MTKLLYKLRTYHLDNLCAFYWWIRQGWWRKTGYDNFAGGYRYIRYKKRQWRHNEKARKLDS